MGKSVSAPDKNEKFPLEVVSKFFPPSDRKEDQTFPPLLKIGEALKNQGIAQSQLKEALAVIIGIMSTKWGDPVPIVITEDEGAGVVEFLDTCLSVVPEECWLDESTLNKKAGTNGVAQGKTVVAYDADNANATLSSLLMNAERPQSSKVKRGQGGPNLPSAFVAISRNQDSPLLRSRYVTRIHLTADGDSKNERIKRLANQAGVDVDNRMKVEGACIKTMLRRIRPLPVNIVFADKIINKQALSVQNVVPIYDMALRIIRNITRINNPPPLHPFEQPAAFIGLDFEDLVGNGPRETLSVILATKVDYFCFLEVFCGLFNAVDDYITPRQMLIYDSIRQFNLQQLEKHRKRGQDDLSLINFMHETDVSSAWITRGKLSENLRSVGGEEVSNSTLNRELQELMQRELIRRIKKPHRTYEFGYGVFQLINQSPLFEPNAALIDDPVFKAVPVDVKRLIGGDMVKI
jgi:hypothetical protein